MPCFSSPLFPMEDTMRMPASLAFLMMSWNISDWISVPKLILTISISLSKHHCNPSNARLKDVWLFSSKIRTLCNFTGDFLGIMPDWLVPLLLAAMRLAMMVPCPVISSVPSSGIRLIWLSKGMSLRASTPESKIAMLIFLPFGVFLTVSALIADWFHFSFANVWISFLNAFSVVSALSLPSPLRVMFRSTVTPFFWSKICAWRDVSSATMIFASSKMVSSCDSSLISSSYCSDTFS